MYFYYQKRSRLNLSNLKIQTIHPVFIAENHQDIVFFITQVITDIKRYHYGLFNIDIAAFFIG